MSFDGHVLCHRILITPWALTTFGAATADAVAVAAATLRKLRRVGRAGLDGFDIAFLSLDFGWPCRPSLFDQPRAYRPISSNSIAVNSVIARLHTYRARSWGCGATRRLAAPRA